MFVGEPDPVAESEARTLASLWGVFAQSESQASP